MAALKHPTHDATLRTLLTVVGLVAALGLVWFVGPLVAFGGVAPLAGDAARWQAVAIVAVAAAVFAAWRMALDARNNRRLLERLIAPGAAAPQTFPDVPGPGEKEVAVIGERFERAVALLKRRRGGGKRAWLGALGGQAYVYELPWYVIIGAPGAGKTTALVNSGLRFPLEAQLGRKVIRGIGGTRNCDWWFADEAVLIDTAGRYTTHDSNRAADRTAWLGFLDLLAQYRPGRPLNGVLLTLSASDLLHPDPAKRLAHARDLRERIDELHARLGIRLPIYVLVTKTDLLAGFVEFFADFDKDERAQVWGVTFPYDTELTSDDPLARMPSDLAALERRLNECLIDRLEAEHDRDRRAAIYTFPQQWRVLRETLLEMLPVIFGETRDERRPFLRGLYFTSATQEGTPMDRAIGGLARALGLSGRIVPPARSSAKTFFVTRMLRDVVLREAGLAGTNLRWQRRRTWLANGVALGVACVALAALALLWYAYDDGRARIAQLGERVAGLAHDVDVAKGAAPTDLIGLLPALRSLQAMMPPVDPSSRAWPAWLDIRLGQGEMFAAAARDAYQRSLKESFLPRIAARLEERLRAGSRDHPDRVYEDLKAYLMLFGGKNFDAAALRAFLGTDWDVTLPPTITAEDRDALRRHLDRLLAGGEVGAPSEARPQIVANARSLVSGVPLAQRAYERLKQLDLGPEAPPFTIESAGGAQARRVFVRASGQPLNRGVPGLYSRAVFQRSFRQRTQDVLRQLAGEQGWVLGTSGAGAMEPAAQARLVDEIERMYVADYARAWDEFVNDLRLVPSSSLASIADTAQVLAHADSPLLAVLRGVVREVSVAPASPSAAAAGEPLIDPRFAALQQYVAAQPSALEGAITLFGRLGTHLSAVDDAIKRKTPPPSSDVIQELAAAGPRAPEPVRGMLVQLAQASAGQAFAVLREPLGRQLAEEIGPACMRAVGGRYPIARSSTQEISRDEFTRTFAVGGLLDAFFQRSLAPYVDTTARPWAFRRADGTRGDTAESLQQFQRAHAIRQAFFRDGGRVLGAPLEFRLTELDPGIKQFTLEVDGQLLRFARDQKAALSAQWPGSAGAGRVRLQVTPTAGGNGPDYVFDGPWALFRLVDRVRIEPGSAPDRAQMVFDVEGRKARFDVRSATPANPLLRQELEQFQCPKRL